MIRHLIFAVLFVSSTFSHAVSPRVLAWDEVIAARKLALVSGGSSVLITNMHPSKRTGPLKIKGSGPYVVRALDKGPGPDGKPLDRACPIPEGIKVPLLVILPDESHPTGVRLLIVDDDPTGFRWGSYRFLNASPKELVVQMEKKAIRVPTGWKPVDLDLGGETRGIGARVALSEAIEKPLYSAVWEYNTDIRILCFLVPGTDPRLSPVDFKAIPEDRTSLRLDSESGDSKSAP